MQHCRQVTAVPAKGAMFEGGALTSIAGHVAVKYRAGDIHCCAIAGCQGTTLCSSVVEKPGLIDRHRAATCQHEKGIKSMFAKEVNRVVEEQPLYRVHASCSYSAGQSDKFW